MAGRIACSSTLPMNGRVSDGVCVMSKPNADGSQFSWTAKTRISIIPIQKYGNADVITKIGGGDAVEPPAAAPGGQDPDHGAEDEGEDRRDADQPQRPGQRVEDDPADGLRKKYSEVPNLPVATSPR